MAFRWPWQRRPEPVAPPPAEVPRTPSPMGWAFLPPIQRQLEGPMPRLSLDFSPAAWQSPGFTGDLTHAVADGSPGGVIDGDGSGLGRPSETTAPAPEMTLLPPPRPTVQRRATTPTTPPLAPPPAASPRSLVQADPQGLPLASPPVVAEESHADPGADEVADPEHPPVASETAPEPTGTPEPTGPTGPTAEPGPTPAPVQRSVAPRAGTGEPSSRPRLGLGPPLPQVPDSAVSEPGVPQAHPGHPGHSELAIPQAPTRRSAPPMDMDRTDVQRAADPRAPAVPEAPSQPPAAAMPLAADAATPDTTPDAATPDATADAEPPTESTTVPEIASPAEAPPETAATEPHEAPAPEPAGVTPEPDPGPAVAPVPIGDLTAAPEITGPAIQRSVSSAPLPLVTGIRTSLQRSAVLPGPGQPSPGLRVAAAGTPTARPARVVPVQRIAAEPVTPPAPPTTATPPAGSPAAPVNEAPRRGGRWWRRASSSDSAVVQRTTTPVAPTSSAAATAVAASDLQVSRHAAPGARPVATPSSEGGTATGDADQAPIDDAVQPTHSQALQPQPTSSTFAAPSHPTVVARTASVQRSRTPPVETASRTTDGVGRTDLPVVPHPPAPPAGPAVEGDEPSLQRLPEPAAGPPSHHPDDRGITGLPVVVPHGPAPPSGPSLALPAHVNGSRPAVEVQRTADPGTGRPPAPVQRRAVIDAMETTTEPASPEATASTGAGSAAEASPAAAAAGAGGGPEVDELARQLFRPMLRLFRAELLVDRERRGMRTDRW